MKKPKNHIFVCMSFRGTEAKGKCMKTSGSLLQYIGEEAADRGLDLMVSTTGCMNVCDEGPIMVVYPQGWWYKGVSSEEAVDAILDGLEEGKPCEEYLLA